ncbi:MAG: glycine oxidase ThiO [Bryobacterales bacterium]|nr:glycine oxidase ThiO [Bryobacterales bacterium]
MRNWKLHFSSQPDVLVPDVLVIGGGIIGASIAWQLSKQQLSVAVCDARGLGQEASWAGAGMLVPGSEFDEPNEWLALGQESLALYPDFVSALQEESGEPIDFAMCGALEIADTPEHFALLERRAAAQGTMGIRTERVDQAALPRILRPGLAGAIYYAGDAQVDPRTVMQAFRAALSRRGVRLIEGDGAVSMDTTATRPVVTLRSGGRIEPSHVVLAAGAWATLIPYQGEGMPALPVAEPVKGHLVGYDLPAQSLPHILRFHHTYVVQRRSGYTIAGATVERDGFNRSVELASAWTLAASAHELAPGLLPPKPRDAWMGFRPGIAAEGPRIERWGSSNVWLAYGHYRNGILFAPATAARIAKLIGSA